MPIVVNARTDPYWLKLGDKNERLRTSIERANRYREAGAHCLFVPGAVDRATLKTLVAEIAGPHQRPRDAGCPPVAELEALGVRRLSEGSGPMRASLMLARRIARDLVEAAPTRASTTTRSRTTRPTRSSVVGEGAVAVKFRAAVLNAVGAPLTVDTLAMAPLRAE